MKDKDLFFREFNDGLHRIGRAMMVLMIAMLLTIPFLFAAVNGVGVNWNAFVEGILKVNLSPLSQGMVVYLRVSACAALGASLS